MKSLVFTVLVCLLCTPSFAQDADLIRWLPPDSIDIDIHLLQAHRLEMEETTLLDDGSQELDSYTYLTVEHGQSWGEQHLMVEWRALTWNGTGFDINLAAAPNLALRARVTPQSVPFGHFVESHYYPGQHNRTAVNPDGEVRRYETEAGGSVVYNEILWPYLLSQLDLRQGLRFVLPGYSPYSAEPFFYVRFNVLGRVTVNDEEGHTLQGWQVEGIRTKTLAEAQAASGKAEGRRAVYYVSADAPYFLGKEWYRVDDAGQIEKRWRLTAYRVLEVTPSRRMQEILRVRDARGAEQVIPWQRRTH